MAGLHRFCYKTDEKLGAASYLCWAGRQHQHSIMLGEEGLMGGLLNPGTVSLSAMSFTAVTQEQREGQISILNPIIAWDVAAVVDKGLIAQHFATCLQLLELVKVSAWSCPSNPTTTRRIETRARRKFTHVMFSSPVSL